MVLDLRELSQLIDEEETAAVYICPDCGEELQESGEDAPLLYCDRCGIGWNDPASVPRKEVGNA